MPLRDLDPILRDEFDAAALYRPGDPGWRVWSARRGLAHLPECHWARRISPANRQRASRAEAMALVKRPALCCLRHEVLETLLAAESD
ncbi:hypothetical protein caldi_26200 [Caldinitratiruptor microaerophilus]|uniref:Uncharacterized protein n=1 Tax=Caldinitratiruptor microaerophilus TaxID=671077 RepID=A0AA35CLI3_9FIRM|nr:hypothetical protein caldi_26200 [Caldinitratiruptor microaerophilus]